MVIVSFTGSAAMAAALMAIAQAGPSTTETYTYDARGRLVDVQRSGGTNNGIRTQYEYDAADNRTRRRVTGA